MAFNPAFSDAISSIESGGRYGLLGPATRSGDRAYGKYQVMGSNIPVWTREILGQSMTPQQFLANPQAQDAVFQGKFSQYLNKYGNPEDAASVWFSGQPLSKAANRSDVFGTTGASYVQKFDAALNRQPQPQTAAPMASPQVMSSPQLAQSQPVPQVPQTNPIQPSPANSLPSLASAPVNLSALSGLAGLFGGADQSSQQASPPPSAPVLHPFPFPFRRPPDVSGLAQLLQTAPAPIRGLILGA